MSRAAAFLARFVRADREDALLHAMADDPDGLMAAMAEAPEALLSAAQAAVAQGGPPADPDRGGFASAACDSLGQIVTADARFRDWLGGPDPLAAAVRRLDAGRPCVSVIAGDASGRPVAVAAARLATARGWPLAPAVRAALDVGAARYAVIAFRPDDDAWDRAARAHGLSRQQARLAAALARSGNLADAAAELGVAYETARKLVAGAMRKIGAARQADLVRRVMQAAAGSVPAAADAPALFSDLFGLNRRQAALAQLVARGVTREAAAARLNMSGEAARSAMKVVYQACGVGNAVDLSRIVAEVDALAGLAAACSVELPATGDEPLRLLARRRAPGQIAFTDHGPPRGRPVIHLHTAVGGRHMPGTLVAALQAAGWRPISIDRPGFGLSTMIDGQPWEQAADDLGEVLDALGLVDAVLLSRTAAMVALTVAERLGGRICGGVLVGPEPPAALDTRWSGMMGRGKSLFFNSSLFAAAFATIMSRRTSSEQIVRMQRDSVAGSAIDEAVMDDPACVADIVRASRQAALGLHGFVAEMRAQGSARAVPALRDGRRWTVIVGARDPLYDGPATGAYWQAQLPGAALVVLPDGGRWLHFTHVPAIVAALQRLC